VIDVRIVTLTGLDAIAGLVANSTGVVSAGQLGIAGVLVDVSAIGVAGSEFVA
jgi:hypothetical protein